MTDDGRVIIRDPVLADVDLAERYSKIAEGTNGKVVGVKWLERQLINRFPASQGSST